MRRDGNATHELLRLSAPLARALAKRSCEGCGWYHGLWQYLRLLDAIEPMSRHAGFFERALRSVRSREPRILVCGAADYWTYARVLAAFRGRRARPIVVAIDLCETPLALIRWYAKRMGARLSTRRCDVLAFRPSVRFDAICTHAILGRFSPPQRPELMAKWYSLLRPGGAVITVTPMRDGDPDEPVRFTAAQAGDFVARVEEAAKARGLDVAQLTEDARAYARQFQVYRVPSRASIGALFEGAGYSVERLRSLPPAARRGQGGPTRAGAEYLQIVARRP